MLIFFMRSGATVKVALKNNCRVSVIENRERMIGAELIQKFKLIIYLLVTGNLEKPNTGHL